MKLAELGGKKLDAYTIKPLKELSNGNRKVDKRKAKLGKPGRMILNVYTGKRLNKLVNGSRKREHGDKLQPPRFKPPSVLFTAVKRRL